MIGQHIGNYRIVRQIGEGGMGVVYEALHEPLSRRAAVKTLHRELAQAPDIVARFFNEARAVNLVTHPGLVSVFEFGLTDRGVAYIIMEYLDGEPLSARLARRGRLGLDALRIARQVASALQAVHNKGIVHRDLKPDNIFLVPDPDMVSGERAKVLDFGIAKLAEGSFHQTHTMSGVLMGTPLYMAPEQCRGASGVTDRADVYALGVLLYQMVCGQTPFMSEGLGEIMAMHLYRAPTPLGELAPEAPAGLCALVHSMLAKEPAARPSMGQVARALEKMGALLGHGSLPPPRSCAAQVDDEATVHLALGHVAEAHVAASFARPRWSAMALGFVLALSVSGAILYRSRGSAAAPLLAPVAAVQRIDEQRAAALGAVEEGRAARLPAVEPPAAPEAPQPAPAAHPPAAPEPVAGPVPAGPQQSGQDQRSASLVGEQPTARRPAQDTGGVTGAEPAPAGHEHGHSHGRRPGPGSASATPGQRSNERDSELLIPTF